MANDRERELIDAITRDLVSKGLLIEAGWVGLRMMSIPKDAPKDQLDEMRNSFFAGAQHLFASIIGIMDADREPTANDMKAMDDINRELQRFINDYSARHLPTSGSA
jgi:hypothetical protein